MPLTARQNEILQTIFRSARPKTVYELMNLYHVSERTIRYDLSAIKKELNKNNINLYCQSNEGYYITFPDKTRMMDMIGTADLMESNDDDAIYQQIVVYLFLNSREPGARELADHFHLSISNLRKILEEMNQRLSGFQIVRGHKGYQLSGDELEIRKYVISAYSIYIREAKISDDTVKLIADGIKQTNNEFDLWQTDEKYNAMKKYCAAAFLRSNPDELRADITDKSPIEEQYASRLLFRTGIKQTKTEIENMIRFMHQSGIFITNGEICRKYEGNLQAYAEHVSEAVSKAKGLKVDVEGFIKDIRSHIIQLQQCIQFQVPLPQNPLLYEIKSRYGDYFNIAKEYIADLNNPLIKNFSDDEIGYLTIYLYKNLKTSPARKKVLVVCSTGKGLSSLLAAVIRNDFPDLDVLGAESAYGVLHKSQEADFLITTVDLPNSRIPYIKISYPFDFDDYKKIYNYLHPENQIPGPSKAGVSSDQSLAALSQHMREDSQSFSVVSSLILRFLSVIENIGSSIKVSSDTILGAIIHMCLAVPRWLEGEETDNAEIQYCQEEIRKYKEAYPDVDRELELFFEDVEKALFIKLNAKDKYAFYLYLMGREGNK